MAQQNINIGTSANKGDGDPIRTAFTKVNANFTELYAQHDGTIAQKTDVQGSVFGDDSTVIIDAVSNKVNLDGTVKGNIIPDFSHCGYMGGGVSLPEVVAVMTVEPQTEGDDTQRLQDAINEVSKRPVDANGFEARCCLSEGNTGLAVRWKSKLVVLCCAVKVKVTTARC